MSNHNNNFNLFTALPKNNRLTPLEERGVLDRAMASLSDTAKQAGKTMPAEFAKGNVPGGMYLAATATELAQAARQVSEHSKTHQQSSGHDNAAPSPRTRSPGR